MYHFVVSFPLTVPSALSFAVLPKSNESTLTETNTRMRHGVIIDCIPSGMEQGGQ